MRWLLSLREIQVHQEVKNERVFGQNFQNTMQLLLKLYIFFYQMHGILEYSKIASSFKYQIRFTKIRKTDVLIYNPSPKNH